MVEILAPAGSEEAFYAALRAGADAVYLGGSRFGARAYADNFNEETLLHTIDEAHLFGKKIYLTVNTLVKENELEDFYRFLLPYYRAGLDAVIVQDLGALLMIRECFPEIHIHASTQMTVTGSYGASFLRKNGADRVVPARELSLEEIRKIRESSDIEIECFVHGALCYCYSGQCLMSSLAGGRSGNRGRCAQPCRLSYEVEKNGRRLTGRDNGYALNTKDICTLDLLPELIAAGVDSFKIEGRMKRPEYTAGVTSVYRKYTDLALSGEKYAVEEEDRRFLAGLFNREGFSRSYYEQYNGPSMMAFHNAKRSVKESEETRKLYGRIGEEILSRPLKKELSAEAQVRKDGARLKLSADGICGEAFTAGVFEARTQAMTEESFAERLARTGGTDYTVVPVSVRVEEGLFMTAAAQNELRRSAILDFGENLRRQAARTGEKPFGHEIDTFLCNNKHLTDSNPEAEEPELTAYAGTAELFRALGESGRFARIYLPAALFAGLLKEKKEENFIRSFPGKSVLALAPVPRRADRKEYLSLIRQASELGMDFLAGCLEDAVLLRELGLQKRTRLDAGIYTMNSRSHAFLAEAGFEKDTVPYELNRQELAGRDNSGSELVIYGRLPLMVSAQCLNKNYDRCSKNNPRLLLTDRKKYRYPVECDCLNCLNIIRNPLPLSLISKKEEVLRLSPSSCRMIFTDETPEEALALAEAWIKGGAFTETFAFTRGHFNRGVE